MSSTKNIKLFIFVSLLMFSVTLVFAGLFNVSASNRAGAASLSASKNGYASGETVVLTGRGFATDEEVSITVESYLETLGRSTPLMQWTVVADQNGGIAAEFPFDALNAESGRMTVRAIGLKTGATAETIIGQALPSASADLDQCGNGPFSAPVPCTGSAWQNGNIGQSQGHYYEGDSVPYRLKFDNLPTGAGNPHSITIEWDTTQAGKHAIDYLTSYNRTEAVGNNPCSGVVPACGPASTFPIPLDPNVSGAGVTQIGGQVFTIWGGTITGTSAYTLDGLYTGNSATRITINFIANQANPVLAWGGHIADRNDWATMGGSASDIPGSPYHMRLFGFSAGNVGNQDRSLSNVAVRLNTRVIIIQQASPETTLPFGFTTVNLFGATNGTNLVPAAFSLIDDGVDNDATPNNITFDNLLAPATNGSFSVTQSSAPPFYALLGLTCTVGTGGTSTTTTDLGTKTANINLVYGDTVTCVYNSQVVTAANVSAGGTVLDEAGQPISRARVTIQNATTGENRTVLTNSFGRYRFEDLPVGDLYVVSVAHRRFDFDQSVRTFQLDDAVEDVDFVGRER